MAASDLIVDPEGGGPLDIEEFAQATSLEVERLSRENDELRRRIWAAAGGPGASTDADALLAHVRATAAAIVEKAQRDADSIIAAADRRAVAAVAAARSDADSVREVARTESSALIADARREHARVADELRARQRTVDREYQEVARQAGELADAIEGAAAQAPVHLAHPAG